MADALATQLPDDLAARIEERVYIESDEHRAPVRRPDVRVVEDLQPFVDRVYRLSRFDRIDYSKPCEPPLLGEEDAAWARERIAAASVNPT